MSDMYEEKVSELLSEKFDGIFQFRQSLSEETDRGCALMAAAYLDVEIEKLLNKHFVDNEKVKNEILGQSRPLGTFSSRIDLAYLLGLIGPNVHRDLHLIRKVRNEFAHVPTPIDFDNPSLSARCKELFHDSYGKEVSARTKFNRCVMGVLGIIHASTGMITSTQEAKDVSIEDAKKRTSEFIEAFIESSKK